MSDIQSWYFELSLVAVCHIIPPPTQKKEKKRKRKKDIQKEIKKKKDRIKKFVKPNMVKKN